MTKAGYVAIVGRPNTGKSTLLNALLQSEVSIVTPKPQTTRVRVQGILTEPKGQIVFMDTPGIHRARADGINKYMVDEAKEALEAPDLIWYMVDPNTALHHEEPVLDMIERSKNTPVLLLMNKMDKLREPAVSLETELLAEMAKRGIQVKETLRISALAKKGLEGLVDKSWAFIPEGHPFYSDPDQLSDRPTRFFVEEKIRERLFYLLGEEVPYSCAVEVQTFKENVKPIRIEAVIFVERESQKGIVIGQGGKKIKDIGQSARVEIEKFLGEKIFLGLKVKVLTQWTESVEGLRRAGYQLPEKRKSK